MKQQCLGLFAKYWDPGKVKTRLARTIGEDRAAVVSRLLLETSIERLDRLPCKHWLVYTPAERGDEMGHLLPKHWNREAQVAGDLGQRMQAFAAHRLEEGFGRVVLLGSDSPHVPMHYIEQAFEELNSHQIVLGPSEDGGYWLIGFSEHVPAVFEDVQWSSPEVWKTTLRALESQKLSCAEVPAWYDIDEEVDLQRMIAELHGNASLEPALEKLRNSVIEEGLDL